MLNTLDWNGNAWFAGDIKIGELDWRFNALKI